MNKILLAAFFLAIATSAQAAVTTTHVSTYQSGSIGGFPVRFRFVALRAHDAYSGSYDPEELLKERLDELDAQDLTIPTNSSRAAGFTTTDHVLLGVRLANSTAPITYVRLWDDGSSVNGWYERNGNGSFYELTTNDRKTCMETDDITGVPLPCISAKRVPGTGMVFHFTME